MWPLTILAICALLLLIARLLSRLGQLQNTVSKLNPRLDQLAEQIVVLRHSIQSLNSTARHFELSSQVRPLPAPGPNAVANSIYPAIPSSAHKVFVADGRTPPEADLATTPGDVYGDTEGGSTDHAPVPDDGVGSYHPMEHLLVTAHGEQWVPERLPKEDRSTYELSEPSVCALISKPAGYRIIRGYNLLQEDDVEDSDEWGGFHLLQENNAADSDEK